MENQKVRDLSTAQSPKATDFVMLITNLTNNVLEKCSLSALREVLTINNISEDEGNGLTLGSDDKLYVADASEEIGIVQSNLENLEEELNQDIADLQSNKINVDADNINAIGKAYISGLGMPSNRYIDLTLGASGSTYTAPANGWMYLQKATTSANQYILMTNRSAGGIADFKIQPLTFPIRVYVPCKKNDVIFIQYTADGNSDTFFRFIYAEGEQ